MSDKLRFGLYQGVNVCGVDCTPQGDNCSGYCINLADEPYACVHAQKGDQLLLEERVRQLVQEKYSDQHDDKHTQGELIRAAESYLLAADYSLERNRKPGTAPSFWPFEKESWKPSVDPVKNLVKAGALIMAEIDRLLRIAVKEAREETPKVSEK